MSHKPNFFIVGAPKCGTTSLFEYLLRHPDVYMPPCKEISYFGSDLLFRNHNIDEDDYLSLFEKCKNEKAVGEASVWYLYSKKAAEEIKAFNPEAKIIIMIRKPVDMIYSLYHQIRCLGQEPIGDFRQALDAEQQRLKGKNIPFYASAEHLFFYRDAARYFVQIERYYRFFDQSNIHIIVHDDFHRDAPGEYKKVLQFLGVDEAFQPEFKRYNTNKRARIRWIAKYIPNPPRLLVQFVCFFSSLKVRQKIRSIILERNTVHEQRLPIDPDINRTLILDFKEEVENLSKLLKRDLSSWNKL